jgi:cell wall-associated NlpC family hydrolase
VRLGRNALAAALFTAAVAAGSPAAVPAGPAAAGQGGLVSRPAGSVKIAGTVIAYAEAQIGKPYLWGGTGPDAFDCSGLVMMAYRAAGITIARTSQDQWKTEPHIPASQAGPGDLVFFAGGDGTAAAPGHVGLVIGNGRMVEAYATGFPVRIASYGLASSPPGDQDPVGFTDPAAAAGGQGAGR